MSLPAFTTTVTHRDAEGVTLSVRHPGLPQALWPSLVPALLTDRLTDTIDLHMVHLVQRTAGKMVVRVAAAALAQQLQDGESWQSNPHRQFPPVITDADWAPDGKQALIGYDCFAELVYIAQKGIGRTLAVLNHCGLHTVRHSGDQLLTASSDRWVVWSSSGAPLRSASTDDAITAAALVGDTVVLGTVGGRVYTIGAGIDIDSDLGHPVTALRCDHGCILAAAGGVVHQWNRHGDPVARYPLGRHITALGIGADGRLTAGDDHNGVWVLGESCEALPTYDIKVASTHARWTAHGDAVLTYGFGGYIWEVSLDGEATSFSDMEGVAFVTDSPSGQYRAAGSKDRARLHIYHRDRGLVRSLECLPVKNRFKVVFSPREEKLALIRKDAAGAGILVVDLEGSGAVVLMNPHAPRSQLLDIAWLDEDHVLAACCNEPSCVWTLSSQTFHTDVADHDFPIIHPGTGGGLVALCDHKSEPLTVLDAQTLSVRYILYESGIFPSSFPPRVQVSQDGQRALMCNAFVGAWVVSADREPWCLPHTAAHGEHNNVHGILSACGRWAAVSIRGRGIQIVDTETQSIVAEWKTKNTNIEMTFVDTALHLIDRHGLMSIPLDGGPVQTRCDWPGITNPPYRVSHLHHLPDGRLLKSTRYVSSFWDGVYYQHTRESGRLLVSPDGERGLQVQGGMLKLKDMAWV